MQTYFQKPVTTINELEEKVLEELKKNRKTIESLQQQLKELTEQQEKVERRILQQNQELKNKQQQIEKLGGENSHLKTNLLEKEDVIEKLNNKVFFEKDKSKKLEEEKMKLEIQLKKPGLEKLLNSVKSKLSEEAQEILENLLEAQMELITNKNNTFAQRQLVKSQKVLSKYNLTERELDRLITAKKEIIQLEQKLIDLQFDELGLEANIEIYPNLNLLSDK